jgi:hypothetical protein
LEFFNGHPIKTRQDAIKMSGGYLKQPHPHLHHNGSVFIFDFAGVFEGRFGSGNIVIWLVAKIISERVF